MSRVCLTATLHRTSLIPTRSAYITYRNAFTTQPAYVTAIPYTTCRIVTVSSTRTCSSYQTTMYNTVPRHIQTIHVPYTVTVQGYITSVTTYYSTSCSTVRGYTPQPTPTPTTQTLTTISTITDSTGTLVPQSTIPGNTDSLSPTSTDASSGRNLPVVPIVAGVVGGMAGAALLGLLIFLLFFRKSRTSKKQLNNNPAFDSRGTYHAVQDGRGQQDGLDVHYNQPTGSSQYRYTELSWQGHGTYYGDEPLQGGYPQSGAQTSQTPAMPVAAIGSALYASSSTPPPTSTSPDTTRQSITSNLSATPLVQQQQQPYAGGGGQFYAPFNAYSSAYRGYGEPQDSR